jgi:hypothetical protein
MNNIREIIRRFIKYVLNAFIVFLAAQSILKESINKSILISIVSATTFAIIDMVAPTISIIH